MPSLPPARVNEIAQGRVWDGGTAHQLGLVDRFGNLNDAVAEAARGQGLGGRIVDLFLDWLTGQGVIHVEASVSPDNGPSLRLLARRGFVETGERWDDEDGRELVLSRRLERTAIGRGLTARRAAFTRQTNPGPGGSAW